MEYYRVLFSSEYSKKNGRFGIICTIPELDDHLIADGELFPFSALNGVQFYFEGESNKVLADFQMMYHPWRLISEKMYRILREYEDIRDVIFYEVSIEHPATGRHKYFLMHFETKLDVIDKSKTGNSLMNPVLDVKKLTNQRLFVYKEFDPSVFCTDESLKNKFEVEGMSGCTFQKISS